MQQPYRTVSSGNRRPYLSIRLLFNHRVKTIFERRCVFMTKQTTPTSSYKEVRIGKTIYRVTSFFSGEKDLGKTLEQLAVRRAMSEAIPAASGSK
ncbi:hypothetical protein D7Y41_35750 [Anaerotruncus sp. 1XD22-93]|nr:hypothetical protein D7Y41_35750 [Anaerotruncus sp. 1XD22-93]